MCSFLIPYFTPSNQSKSRIQQACSRSKQIIWLNKYKNTHSWYHRSRRTTGEVLSDSSWVGAQRIHWKRVVYNPNHLETSNRCSPRPGHYTLLYNVCGPRILYLYIVFHSSSTVPNWLKCIWISCYKTWLWELEGICKISFTEIRIWSKRSKTCTAA